MKKLKLGLVGLAASVSVMAAEPVIEIVVGFPAGGSNDLIGRSLQQVLIEKANFKVVVTNKIGGDGVVAYNYYSINPSNKILILSPSNTEYIAEYKKASGGTYDPINNLDYIVPIAVQAFTLMVPYDSKYQTLADLEEDARHHNINCGVQATTGTFMLQYLQARDKFPLNIIPYKGGAAVDAALLANQVDCGIDTMSGFIPYEASKKLRILTTFSTDHSHHTNIKPVDNHDLFEFFNAIGLSNKMDPEIRNRIIELTVNLKNDPEFVEKHKSLGMGFPAKMPTDYKKVLQKNVQALSEVKEKYKLGAE